MSDQQKIWFIYLTDHHEGPFTASEIAEKAKAGLVNGQSLAWKDGMPEWVPAETIPELAAAVGNAAAVAQVGAADLSGVSKTANMIAAPASGLEAEGGSGLVVSGATGVTPAPGTDTSDGEVSLAQLLAQQQSGGGNTVSGQISDSASVLSSMLAGVQKDNPVTIGSGVSIGGITQQTKSVAGDPAPDEEAWTLKIGAQVSGMHSLNKLKELASSGEIPPDAMVWHSGWNDFQPVSTVASIDAARKKAGTKTNTKTSMTRPGMMVSGQSNQAVTGDDEEPTDTDIEAPPPPGIKGVIFKLKGLLKRKKKPAPAAAPAPAPAPGKGKVTLAPVGAPKKTAFAGPKGTAAKRIAAVLIGIAVLGGIGFGAWKFLLSSPLPSDLDVSEEDKAALTELVKTKLEGQAKLAIAQAKGSEDSPADPTSPKYYVASNLAEGATVTLTVTGTPGTLVNRTSFEKSFTATIDKTHLATFDQIKDDGKPLWGDFSLKASADGADPVELKGMFIGAKGPSYQNRLKQFKESVQGEYDKEVEELRQFITTLKSEQADASRLIKEYKELWAIPANRTKVNADWTQFNSKSQNFLGQVEQKLKERMSGQAPPKYHARAFQDVSTTLGQVQQLVKSHGERLAGSTSTSGNPDELDGLVQAGVLALETWLAQAVSKSPFDASRPANDKLPSPPPAGGGVTPPAPEAPSMPQTPANATPPAGTTPLPAPAPTNGPTGTPSVATPAPAAPPTTTTPAPAAVPATP